VASFNRVPDRSHDPSHLPHHHTPDTNSEIWKSDRVIADWVATSEDRERTRTDQRRLMADLLPFGDDEAFTFVDLGAGTGAAARAILDRFQRASAILADYSPQMMQAGTKALAAYEGRYSYVEFDVATGSWPDAIPAPVAAMVSSLCVHHLPHPRKQALFAEILERLSPGGWFLNFDPVTADDSVVEAAWQRANDRQDPAAAAQRSNRTEEEQRRYENHVRYILPLAPQLQYLQTAGFEAVDAYWKRLDHVVFGGRRPVN
jgi:tRNA (cmo5U34)-methyltransferase